MISIGRNPGPRYLVARKEKLHAGNVIPNNLKIASLWFVWWDIWWGLDLQCKFKFARFVSPVSIFRITILEQYKPVASLLPTPHHTQIQASRSAPANWPPKYKPVAPLLPTPHTHSLLYGLFLNLASTHQFSTLNPLFWPFGERVRAYMIKRRCLASSGGHFSLPNSYIHPTKLCSGKPHHLCKSATCGPSPGDPPPFPFQGTLPLPPLIFPRSKLGS